MRLSYTFIQNEKTTQQNPSDNFKRAKLAFEGFLEIRRGFPSHLKYFFESFTNKQHTQTTHKSYPWGFPFKGFLDFDGDLPFILNYFPENFTKFFSEANHEAVK